MPNGEVTRRQAMPITELQRIQAEKRAGVPPAQVVGVPRRVLEVQYPSESEVKNTRDQLAVIERKITESDVKQWKHVGKVYSKKEVLHLIQNYKGAIRNYLTKREQIDRYLDRINRIDTQWGRYTAQIEEGRIILTPPSGMPDVNQVYFETQHAPPGTTFQTPDGKPLTQAQALDYARQNKDFYWLTEGLKIYAKENPLGYAVHRLSQLIVGFPDSTVTQISSALGLISEEERFKRETKTIVEASSAYKGGTQSALGFHLPYIATFVAAPVVGAGVGAITIAGKTIATAAIIAKGIKIGGAVYTVVGTGVAIAPAIRTGLKTGEWTPAIEEAIKTGVILIPSYIGFRAGYKSGARWAERRIGGVVSVKQIGAIKIENITNVKYGKHFDYTQRIVQTEVLKTKIIGKPQTIERTYLIKGKGIYSNYDTQFISKRDSFTLRRGITYAIPEKAYQIVNGKQKSISLKSLGITERPVEIKISGIKKGLEIGYRPSEVTGEIKKVPYEAKGIKPTVEIKAGVKIYKAPVFKGPPDVEYRPFAIITKVGKKFIKTKGVTETSKLKQTFKTEGKTWELSEQRGIAKADHKALTQRFLVAVEKPTQKKAGFKVEPYKETYEYTVETKARFPTVKTPVAEYVFKPTKPTYKIRTTGEPVTGFKPEISVGIISPEAKLMMLPPTMRVKLGYELKPKTDIILEEKAELRVPVVSDVTAMMEKQAEALKQAQVSIIEQTQIQKQAQQLLISPITTTMPPEKIIPTVGVPFLPPGRKKLKRKPLKKPEGYDTYGKKHATKPTRKWIKLNKKPLKEKQALGLGAKAVDHSVARTFKIKKTQQQVVSKPQYEHEWYQRKHKFRKPIKKGKVQEKSPLWIEESKYLIDSPEEFKGITVEGWKAKQRKRQEKMFMYAGPPRRI